MNEHDLTDLAREIRERHNRLNLRPTVEAAARIGQLLAEAKQLLPHGKFNQQG